MKISASIGGTPQTYRGDPQVVPPLACSNAISFTGILDAWLKDVLPTVTLSLSPYLYYNAEDNQLLTLGITSELMILNQITPSEFFTLRCANRLKMCGFKCSVCSS